MTRRTIYRTLLATLMLPNFTAYWWLLPRRMKRCRTVSQAIMLMTSRYLAESWRQAFEKVALFKLGKIAPIEPQEFRLPFRLTGSRM
jgi:hypothetical protein